MNPLLIECLYAIAEEIEDNPAAAEFYELAEQMEAANGSRVEVLA